MAKVLHILCTRATLSLSLEKCGNKKKYYYIAEHDKFKYPSITEYGEKFKE